MYTQDCLLGNMFNPFCKVLGISFLQGDMLGLLGAALAGASQVAALHSVREGVSIFYFISFIRAECLKTPK